MKIRKRGMNRRDGWVKRNCQEIMYYGYFWRNWVNTYLCGKMDSGQNCVRERERAIGRKVGERENYLRDVVREGGGREYKR